MMKQQTLVLLFACALGACREAEPPTPAERTAEPAAAVAPVREQLARDRIYYDLTRFGWYARGEPLLREGVAYQPAGTPVAAPLSELERIGEYEGVEYYRRHGDPEQLYVPVFDGYWLAFRAGAVTANAN